MSTTTGLKEDLNFVATAVRRTHSPGVPAILLLWAVLVPAGFALGDFSPDYSGLYWFIVGPLGGLLSFYLGHRAGEQAGMVDRALGRRHAMHWITMGVTFVLIAASVGTGHMTVATFAPLCMLVTAMTYTMAGIHLEDSRALLPAGLIMYLGYAALEWLPMPYPWTATGLIVSASLIIAARSASRSGPAA